MATPAKVIRYDAADCRECDDYCGAARIAGSHCGCAPGSRPLAAADLDEIYSGTVYLSVPLLNDIIQVGARGNLTTGTIRVSKTPTRATVRRTDGKPLQAQILHEHPGYIGPTVRTKVFREPVNCLRLQRIRSGDGHRLWLATEAVHVDRHQDLQQFVNTIATFALAKQRKMSGDEKPSSPITTRHVSLPIRHNDDSPTARRHPAPQFTGDADELEDVTPIPASSLGR